MASNPSDVGLANTKKWRFPDWRDPSGYAIPRSWPAWHWEFLRRRAEYQDAWVKFRGDDLGLQRAWSGIQSVPFGATKAADLIDFFVDPVVASPPPNFHVEFPAQRFGLRFLLNPAIPYHHHEMWGDRIEAGLVRYLGITEGDHDYFSGNERAVLFDLSKSIHEQLDAAKESLLRQQAAKGRPGNKQPTEAKLIKALRVLDALSAQTSLWEIAAVIERQRTTGARLTRLQKSDLAKRGSRMKAEAFTLQDRVAPIS